MLAIAAEASRNGTLREVRTAPPPSQTARVLRAIYGS